MARDFTKNSSNYMVLGIGTIGTLCDGASAISAHCWAYADTLETVNSAGGPNTFLNVKLDAGLGAGFTFDIAINGRLRVGGRSQAADAVQATNSGSILTVGSGYHPFGGVCDYTNDLLIGWMDGVQQFSTACTFGSSTYVQGIPITEDAIGGREEAPTTPTQWDGGIAEMAIWRTALSSSDFVALAAGIPAYLIQPNTLVAYIPLYGAASPEYNFISGGPVGTITGSIPQTNHPQMKMPNFIQSHSTNITPLNRNLLTTGAGLATRLASTGGIPLSYQIPVSGQ